MSTPTPTRYLLVDEDEEHLIHRILNDTTHQDADEVAAWRRGSAIAGAVVHGAADGGRLMALPADLAPRRWMVGQLQALAATADHAGRVDGWARRGAVEGLAERIPDDRPDGPGAVRVDIDDLRVLLDAAEGAASRSPQDDADRAWLDTIADVATRVGAHLANHWTEEPGRG
jgi:hypothetical protein